MPRSYAATETPGRTSPQRRQIGEQDGEFTLYEITFYSRTAWYGGWSYVDLIKPGVTQKFLDVTMPGYERAIGYAFGKTTPGIFTDEPNIEPPSRDSLRWTPDLFEQFKQRWGYELAPVLPSLFTETGDWKKTRARLPEHPARPVRRTLEQAIFRIH